MPDSAARALELLAVEKQYGALRPFRLRELRLDRGSRAALLGVDARAAEVFVNLVTGAILPDAGEVTTLGQRTSSISGGDEWLAFVERIGFVSDRVVLLDAMTVRQNLALPFDLQLDPIPADVRSRVEGIAREISLNDETLDALVGESTPLVRALVNLGRALALDPELLLLEHPTAALSRNDSREYAAVLRQIAERRKPTVLALTMDERFAKGMRGRLHDWRPATGELVERRRWF
jgi:ABC-type lipoprotein export system ATPase subunit